MSRTERNLVMIRITDAHEEWLVKKSLSQRAAYSLIGMGRRLSSTAT
jgi:hypothetical protein